MNSLKAHLNKKTYIAAAATAILLVVIVSLIPNRKEQGGSVYRVIRSGISQVVEVTGQVESTERVELGFEKSGTINAVNVIVGDVVEKGKILASISASEAYSALQEAQAQVTSATANLQDVRDGATESELNVKEQALKSAKLDLSASLYQVEDSIRNTENALRDILDYKLGSLFTKDSTSYRMLVNSCDQGLQSAIEKDRATFDNVKASSIDEAKTKADELNSFISKASSLLSMQCSVSDTSLNDKRLALSGARAQLQGVFTEISSKRSLQQGSVNAVDRAAKDLALLKAGADQNKINIAEASLAQAAARLATARSQVAKNVIVAPIGGVVAEVDVEIGELSSANKKAVVIISSNAYEIKTKLAEADIAKVQVGNTATVTVDALPSQEFVASVTRVDPASTNDSGVPRYGVVLTFDKNYASLKSGMTANADITTKSKDGAIVVPAEYIEIKTGGGVVKVKNPSTGESEDKIVKVGVRAQDGQVEIIEGLEEGEVLLPINTVK